jgi:hypothetical protein
MAQGHISLSATQGMARAIPGHTGSSATGLVIVGRIARETKNLDIVGAKAKTPPFARCLRRNRRTNGDKTTGRLTLRPTRHRTKTRDEVVPSLRPRPAWRPTCDPAHCNRPCVAAARYGPNL